MEIFNYSSHLINIYKGDQIGESELFGNNFKNKKATEEVYMTYYQFLKIYLV